MPFVAAYFSAREQVLLRHLRLSVKRLTLYFRANTVKLIESSACFSAIAACICGSEDIVTTRQSVVLMLR